MGRRGFANKTVYCSTGEGVTTQINTRYNPRTDHITFCSAHFHKSTGWCSGIVNNKKCPSYLGVIIAEGVLSKVFRNVDRMPYGNPGYDFICGRGYKIDVKSATKMKTRNAWDFCIRQNHAADYFLCLAFDDRQNLNPQHIWLISGERVNHLSHLGIFVATIDKWSKYELSDKLDKVIACCDMKKTVGVGRR